MLAGAVTRDFETGFADGVRWRGEKGVREFLAARAVAASPRGGMVRVAAQIVDGFAELNEGAARLFSRPDEGLTR